LRIDRDEPFPVGDDVHPGEFVHLGRGAAAAVEDEDQRPFPAGVVRRGRVDVIFALHAVGGDSFLF